MDRVMTGAGREDPLDEDDDLHSPDWEELARRGDERIAALLAARRPRLFVVSGPSGVGKDTVIDRMRERFPGSYFVVTATTRPPRANEVDGVHYRFMDLAEFERREAAGEFLEAANVYGSKRYGVLRGPIETALAERRDVFVKVDVQGAATIKRRVVNAISIFLAPESMAELLNRLRSRKTEDPAELLRRFATASHELEAASEFDYLVVNESGHLEWTVDRLHEIVTVERSRVHQAPVTIL
jgi:guanylate kinase